MSDDIASITQDIINAAVEVEVVMTKADPAKVREKYSNNADDAISCIVDLIEVINKLGASGLFASLKPPRVVELESSFKKAKDFEPTFLLLARDPAAVPTLQTWINVRQQLVDWGIIDNTPEEQLAINRAYKLLEKMSVYKKSLTAQETNETTN